MNKKALHLMTWKEVESTFENDPVVLIPLGSMEEHGPHAITGDFLAATEITKAICDKNDNVLYLPTIPFGNSEYFRSYPGTISLSQSTIEKLIEDVVMSLIEHGVNRIAFINGHAGNTSAINNVVRHLKRNYRDTVFVSINLWQTLTIENKKEIYGEKDPSGHGGEPLSSIMNYLYPNEMRMDLLPNEWEINTDFENLKIDDLMTASNKDSKANIYLNMEEISPQGIMGNPTEANGKRGEQIFNKVVTHCDNIIKSIK